MKSLSRTKVLRQLASEESVARLLAEEQDKALCDEYPDDGKGPGPTWEQLRERERRIYRRMARKALELMGR
jgi:hypothetical protein